MKDILFNLDRPYHARIGRGAVNGLAAAANTFTGKRAVVITDDGVPTEHVSKCASLLEASGKTPLVCVLKSGERNKNLGSVRSVYSFLYENGVTRSDGVIGVGGGIVLDTAGFAAATYMRGLPFISVPTTIIAQTDSAYGGKTGVDFLDGKNHIGVFSHPREVLCDTDFLRTLSEAERVCGMGEVVKYVAIALPHMSETLSRDLPSDELIAGCVDVKKRYVEADEFDTGERHVLNFGHTFGHAFEAASGFSIPHGQAVAYGMLAVAALGERLGITDGSVLPAIRQACIACGLETDFAPLAPSALPLLVRDKKADGKGLELILLEKLGKPVRLKLSAEDVFSHMRSLILTE